MEQALVFASIILGVAVALELENLNRLIRSTKVKWHWAQPIFAVFVLFVIMYFWWTLADDTESRILLGEFVPIMWSMVMLVLLSAVALPDKADEGVDLKEYYVANHRYMWTLVFLFALPLQGQWLVTAWNRSTDLWQFLDMTIADNLAWMIIISLIFIRRWWYVAIAFCILALGPLNWLSRSLG